jgi:hypothetical protein
MLKRLAVLTISAGLATLALSSQPNQATTNEQHSTEQKRIAEPICQHDCYATEETKTPDNHPPSFYASFKQPDGLLVIVGVITCAILIVQSVIGNRAAKAALLNATALVNSERAWLVAEVVKNDRMPHLFEVQITNHGRTPAEFIRGDATHAFIELPENLPVPPVYNSPIVIPRQTLIVTDKGFAIPHGYSMVHILARPDAAGKVFVIYGRILYSDTIIPTVEHETRWCFGYVPDAAGLLPSGDFVLTGPDEYTKHS